MKYTAKGERVGKFTLEGKTKKGWQTILAGSCIGHKFIHCFDAVDVSEIRLKISESKGDPQIKELAVYNIGN